MKHDISKIIADTAQATAQAVLQGKRQMDATNYYRAMEKLLFNYKRLYAITQDRGAYIHDYEIHTKSKSITVAPTSSGGMIIRDHEDMIESIEQERAIAYQRTKARFDEIDTIVQQFAEEQDFIVIRMYYFNEDSSGHDRENKCRYTFEEITEELAAIGITKSERTIRSWRTRIVQDMSVCMFGRRAALTLQNIKQG